MSKRPNIFDFPGYRQYLKSWLSYQKNLPDGLSLRSISKAAKISPGHLSEIFNCQRPMTKNIFNRISPYLKLSGREKKFFWHLVELADGKTIEQRERAFQKISRFEAYKSRNENDVIYHEMMGAWYNMTIWQLANSKDFQADPNWIRNKLRNKITIVQIRDSLRFLINNGFLVKNSSGSWVAQNKFVRADAEILRLSMAHGHREFMELAGNSIHATPRDKRHLLNYTLSLPSSDFLKLKSILENTLKEVNELSNAADKSKVDNVYNVSLYAFPLAYDSEDEAA